MAGDGVGQAPRVIHPHQALQGFLGDLFVQLGISLEPGNGGAAQRLGLGIDLPGLQEFLGLHLEELGYGEKLAGDGPALAFHQHFDGAVGQPQELEDGRQGAQPVNLALPGFVLARVLLGAQQDIFFLPHGKFQGMDGAFPPDKQRHHHVGEDDDIPQGQHGHSEQIASVPLTGAAVFG